MIIVVNGKIQGSNVHAERETRVKFAASVLQAMKSTPFSSEC